MQVIQIGSFAILLKWVLLGLAVMIGIAFTKYWLMQTQKDDSDKKVYHLLLNSLLLGFVIWKGSLFLLEPSLVWKSLFSLLYFTGGSNGLIIAITGSTIYFIFKASKMNIPSLLIFQSGFIFSFSTLSGYHILSALVLNDYYLSHLLLSLFTVLSLSFGLLKRNVLTQKNIFSFIIVFSFLNLILSFVYKEIDNRLFLLSGEQWFFILIIVSIIIRMRIRIIKLEVRATYKKTFVLIGLVGLIGWGMYDKKFSVSETMEMNQESTKVNKLLEAGVQEGQLASDFQLQTLTGEEIKLSDLQGKKVILNFWATWCPPCKAEMPHMQQFYNDQKGNSIEIVAVNLTTVEKDSNTINMFIKDYGLTFPVLLDRTGETGEIYQVLTIPTSYIVDTNGIIRKKIIGPMDKDMMSELINSVD